jgi:hypothetical protein
LATLDRKTLMNLARVGAKARIQELETEISEIRAAFPGLDGSEDSGEVKPKKALTRRKRGKLSAAGRRAIAAAQRARWAKIKAEKSGPTKRKGMSAAAKKAVSVRMKKYWAERRRGRRIVS